MPGPPALPSFHIWSQCQGLAKPILVMTQLGSVPYTVPRWNLAVAGGHHGRQVLTARALPG